MIENSFQFSTNNFESFCFFLFVYRVLHPFDFRIILAYTLANSQTNHWWQKIAAVDTQSTRPIWTLSGRRTIYALQLICCVEISNSYFIPGPNTRSLRASVHVFMCDIWNGNGVQIEKNARIWCLFRPLNGVYVHVCAKCYGQSDYFDVNIAKRAVSNMNAERMG